MLLLTKDSLLQSSLKSQLDVNRSFYCTAFLGKHETLGSYMKKEFVNLYKVIETRTKDALKAYLL